MLLARPTHQDYQFNRYSIRSLLQWYTIHIPIDLRRSLTSVMFETLCRLPVGNVMFTCWLSCTCSLPGIIIVLVTIAIVKDKTWNKSKMDFSYLIHITSLVPHVPQTKVQNALGTCAPHALLTLRDERCACDLHISTSTKFQVQVPSLKLLTTPINQIFIAVLIKLPHFLDLNNMRIQ